MIRTTSRTLLKFKSNSQKTRSFWGYVNMMFNKPDPERIKLYGPDRTCAEWVLRNGGAIVWSNGVEIKDYNLLPVEGTPVPKVREIDGTKSGISHYGFPHLEGCTALKKITLHNASYICDQALIGLKYAKDSLEYVQVSECRNVTDKGLKELKILEKLRQLVIFDLDSVSNMDDCKKFLSTHLPKCTIETQVKEVNVGQT